ncbi:MAG: hypothetical protein ABIQ82_06165 [Variovorax sp.]
MKKLILAAGAATVLSLGAFTVPTVAQAQPRVTVQVAPPPARAERVPQLRRGQVWVPGHWEWRGSRYVWIRGQQVRARPGYQYRHPEWRERDGRWEMRRGQWDRDRDGVPNRADRDRDGDGVPNRADRRPDNPNRN